MGLVPTSWPQGWRPFLLSGLTCGAGPCTKPPPRGGSPAPLLPLAQAGYIAGWRASFDTHISVDPRNGGVWVPLLTTAASRPRGVRSSAASHAVIPRP